LDGSGSLSLEEIIQCIRTIPQNVLEPIQNHSIGELFDILDADGTGNIDEEEFVDGMLQIIVSDADPDIIQILSLSKANRRKIAQIEVLLSKIDRGARKRTVRMGTAESSRMGTKESSGMCSNESMR